MCYFSWLCRNCKIIDCLDIMGGHFLAVFGSRPIYYIADGSSLFLGLPLLFHPRRSDRKPLQSTAAVSLTAHFSPTHTLTHTLKFSTSLNSLQKHKRNKFIGHLLHFSPLLSPQASEKVGEGNETVWMTIFLTEYIPHCDSIKKYIYLLVFSNVQHPFAGCFPHEERCQSSTQGQERVLLQC